MSGNVMQCKLLTYEHVIIRIVDGVQDLGLHRVEVDESVVVDVLVVFVPEGRHGKWLQVQQLGRRRILFRQNQMPRM